MAGLFLDSLGCVARCIVYIDGFNFYYALLRNPKYRACKWLDWARMFRAIRQADSIDAVKYFTAFWPDESGTRHREYVRALGASPSMQVVLGQFKKKEIECRNAECDFQGRRLFPTFEEKETDVNIALSMLDDAYQHACEQMVLVTGDGDLVPAVRLLRARFPSLRIALYVPGPRERWDRAKGLRDHCANARPFPANLLSRFQLPDTVGLEGGVIVRRPTGW